MRCPMRPRSCLAQNGGLGGRTMRAHSGYCPRSAGAAAGRLAGPAGQAAPGWPGSRPRPACACSAARPQSAPPAPARAPAQAPALQAQQRLARQLALLPAKCARLKLETNAGRAGTAGTGVSAPSALYLERCSSKAKALGLSAKQSSYAHEQKDQVVAGALTFPPDALGRWPVRGALGHAGRVNQSGSASCPLAAQRRDQRRMAGGLRLCFDERRRRGRLRSTSAGGSKPALAAGRAYA